MSPMIDRIFNASKMEKWLVDVIKKYDKKRLLPNHLTIIALLLGLISAILIAISGYVAENTLIIISGLCLLSSLILDIFDGILARLRGPTTFGGILDIFSDRLVEVCVIIGVVITDPTNLAFVGLLAVSSIVICITIFLLMGNVSPQSVPEKEKVIFYSRGFIERTETGIFLLLLVCFPMGLIRYILFCIFSGLVLLTAIQRIFIAYKVLKNKETKEMNNP